MCARHYRQSIMQTKPPCRVEGCSTKVRARGLCSKHYARWQTRHKPLKKWRRGEPEKWIRKLIESDSFPNTCIDWPYSMRNDYGILSHKGNHNTLAHRLVLHLKMPCPDDSLHCAHACGRPSCCNPRHLRWATAKENAADKKIHGTNNEGRQNGSSKLTEKQVIEIYNSPLSQTNLGIKYGIAGSTVGKIKRGQKWSWLTGHQQSSPQSQSEQE